VQLFHLNLVGGVLMALLVLFLLSVISHNALNLYRSVLSVITLLQTFAHRWIPTAQSRAGLMPTSG
jgi:NCS1 family nucleobase:cation symporter-1